LLDLTGNSTIDVSNVSFDSNAQMYFDGIGNRIDLSNFYTSDYFTENQDWTISTIINVVSNITSGNGRGGVFNNQRYKTEPDPGGFGLSIFSDNFSVSMAHDDGLGNTTSNEVLSSMPINYGNLECITYTYNSITSTITGYRNGVEEVFSSNAIYNWSPRGIGLPTRIGTNTQGGWGGYFNMEIPIIKVYNRALTPDEIKQNYNAYKNRFNLS